MVYKGEMLTTNEAKKEDKEVICGGDFVTKKLGIPVDINCLYYEKQGYLTAIGEEVRRYCGFKQINDNEALFYGKEIQVIPHPSGIPGLLQAKSIRTFEYKINKNDIGKIYFEENKQPLDPLNSRFESKDSITVKFFDKKGFLKHKEIIYTIYNDPDMGIPDGSP